MEPLWLCPSFPAFSINRYHPLPRFSRLLAIHSSLSSHSSISSLSSYHYSLPSNIYSLHSHFYTLCTHLFFFFFFFNSPSFSNSKGTEHTGTCSLFVLPFYMLPLFQIMYDVPLLTISLFFFFPIYTGTGSKEYKAADTQVQCMYVPFFLRLVIHLFFALTFHSFFFMTYPSMVAKVQSISNIRTGNIFYSFGT